MMPRTFPYLIAVCLAVLAPLAAQAAEPFRLRDGDRIVLLGNTLIEREQRYGYWELALTSRCPERNLTFRNLGWSGDTVFGHARAGFGTPADGAHHLQEHVASIKPTVLLVAYGTNESFDGTAGLPAFLAGLDKLLDTLTATKARIVLLSPVRQEDLGRPLPDPTEQNKNLRLYRDALRKVADQRGYPFVDLFDLLGKDAQVHLTENGIHLSAYGYWRSALVLANALGVLQPPWQLDIDAEKKTALATSGTVAQEASSGIRFELTDAMLPVPPLPAESPAGVVLPERERRVRVRGLPSGTYQLRIDDKAAAAATAAEWAEGVSLPHCPEQEQTERLREGIIAKNREYFYRWRPQNETYLFGFRKQEQGQNAVEVPKFEPLVAELEQDIAKRRVPNAHKYELMPLKDK
jgi:lysophospholipase L1-like esterase